LNAGQPNGLVPCRAKLCQLQWWALNRQSPFFSQPALLTDMTTPLPTAVDTTVLRLLYVEDNRVNAMLFSAMLTQRGGVDLQIAEDAAEALALVGEWTPDVLVLDANLPDMNGYELLGVLRSQFGLTQIPAFMCSADAQAEDIAKAMNSGFTGFWPKPIDIRQVLLDLLPYARDASDSRDASGGHTHPATQPA
jgi:CheY-like chemotaxis protein